MLDDPAYARVLEASWPARAHAQAATLLRALARAVQAHVDRLCSEFTPQPAFEQRQLAAVREVAGPA